MRVFLDSNILISASLNLGQVRRLLDRILSVHEPVVSEEALAESRRKLLGKLGQPKADVDRLEALLRQACLVLPLQSGLARVSRDPKDDWVLAAALAAKCHCILSGDLDLTELGRHRGIPILRPRDFLAFEDGRFQQRRLRPK